MAKDADTWMAFYPGAYLANTLHLTRGQHGSYLMLILAALKAGGVLPNNDATLATIARCTPREWQAEREIFAAFFDVTDEGWTHRRVVHELGKAERLTNQRRVAGTASATARQRPFNGRSSAVDDPLQRRRRPSEPQPDNTLPGESSVDAAREAGDPNGPPGAHAASETERWAERLANHKPLEGKPCWSGRWGLSPDSAGHNPLIPQELYRDWREQYDAGMAAMKKNRG